MSQREHHHVPVDEALQGLENVEKIAAVEDIGRSRMGIPI
jgi:hypothetical protein